jgi:chromosome segregation ATPase
MRRKQKIFAMKQFLSIALAAACAVLVVSLIVVKRGDDAQHETDTGAITDFSNRLDSAQTQIAFGNGTMQTLTNTVNAISKNLDDIRSASSAISNQLVEAQSTIASQTDQIAGLNRQIADAASQNQTLSERAADLTNQLAGLASQLALTTTNLNQATKDYALLENRLRRDVAERLVAERKFNNLQQLQAQLEKLKNNPADAISAQSIYAGLDVEVKSNAFYVISPD